MKAACNRTNNARSQRGASLPMALFLFMICAILVSVVLAATSTVSGRQSKLVQTDQYYYSVASAAELVKDMFDDEIVFELERTRTTTTTAGETAGSTVYEPGKAEFKAMRVNRPNGSIEIRPDQQDYLATDLAKLTLPEQAALYALFGAVPAVTNFSNCAVNIPDNAIGENPVDLNSSQLVFEGSGLNQDQKNELAVSVNGKVTEGEILQLDLESAQSIKDTGTPYSLTLYFEPEITDTVISSDSKTTMSNNNAKETTVDTTTSQVKVKWTPQYISKAGA